jgi:outer membrane receptor protein involved in Fe transport
MEYAGQEIDILSANYFSLFDGEKKSNYTTRKLDLFHTLHLSWELNENQKLNFATSRRISRPPVKNMTPFLYRRHLEVYEVGDPELEPEYMLNAELSFDQKIKKHSFNLVGFYRGVDNAVFRVNTITNENPEVFAVIGEEVLIRSYTNAGNSQSFGAELNANIDAGKYAKLFIGGSLYNYRVKGDIFGYRVNNSSTNWSLKANLNLMVTKELKFTADFNLKSATITAQGQNDLIYLANSALSYSPSKLKGWDFSLRLLDMLDSNVEGLDTQAFNKDGEEIFYQTTDYFRNGRIAELGISYSFNAKGKNRKKSETTFGKEQF